MIRQLRVTLPIAVVVLLGPGITRAQQTDLPAADTIVVQGNRRVSTANVLLNAGVQANRPISFRELQRAIQSLYATGQYDDVQVQEAQIDGKVALVIAVKERPLLLQWNVRGVERVSEGKVKGLVNITPNRPVDPSEVTRSRAKIDSMYRADGYYLARSRVLWAYEPDSTRVRLVFEIQEGQRVAISRVTIEGNASYSDEAVVSNLSSKPEGFFWFQKGEFDDEKLAADIAERLPAFYGRNGYIDFQVLDDTVIVNDTTGKATLILRVSEGDRYHIGTFEVTGNRRFSTEQVDAFYPFAAERRTGFMGLGGADVRRYFDREAWDEATGSVQQAYYNEGYVYAQVRPDLIRRSDAQGRKIVDMRWTIEEGRPAIVSRIEIRGNDITYERVIREAIVLVPGDVFRQNALLQSYQNISNLGFFNQLPPPDTRPNEQGDLEVTFHVSEKRTGNVNFGATIGQGTGVGGFLGLDEANLFGQGKRGQFQWQFGQNVNDFQVQYTDPALFETRLSGTLTLYNRRVRYRIADLGLLRRRGGQIQFGFPLFGDRYTRLFLSYGLDQQSFTGSDRNQAFRNRFLCQNCTRSSVGATLMRDRRIDLPFATAGSMQSVALSQSGGPLGGTGSFQKVELEGRFYAPMGTLGGDGMRQPGMKLTMGLSTRSGFVFGDSPFFEQLFSMGGTQFGIPLRGYDEFSVTPGGYDPLTGVQGASPNSVGKAFFLTTAEFGIRLSQAFYGSVFVDAGNVWADAQHFNPTKLFRGAGIGLSLVSPLGPMGLDYAYGFDKVDVNGRPAPGWKFHFRLGNFF